MGRYTRKMKASDDVTQPLGVLTRARTLALQRSLQSSPVADAGADDSCYLQLRSRRLLKVTPLNPRQKSGAGDAACSGNKTPCDSDAGENRIEQNGRSTRESTPVTPPCSIIRGVDLLPPASPRKPKFTPPVCVNSASAVESNTKFKENIAAAAEQLALRQRLEMHKEFLEKYNFDIFEDEPLPGRYEWEKIDN